MSKDPGIDISNKSLFQRERVGVRGFKIVSHHEIAGTNIR
jgi:hypothetical protein